VAPPGGARGLPATLFLMAVTPAVCEEALFRGPILRGLATRFRPLGAAVATGVLFGLYHVDVWRLIPTGLLGVVLSLVALSTRSIIPAMLTHFVNNACLVVLAHMGADDAAALPARLQVGLFLTACTMLVFGALLVRGSARTGAPDVVL
jgi:sodium transport system permease protein